MSELFQQILIPCSFENITFPVVKADFDGGHSGAEHRAYRRRGADIEPTGQEPYKGSVNVAFINGLEGFPPNLFPEVYSQLIQKFEENPIGMFGHPLLGTFPAFIKSWKVQLDPDVRNGVFLDFQFVEHNGTASLLVENSELYQTDSSSRLLDAAETADDAMAEASPDGESVTWFPVTDTVSTQIDFLEAADRTYGEVKSAVRTMADLISFNLASDDFAGTDSSGFSERHDASFALNGLLSLVYQIEKRYLPFTGSPKTYKVEVGMPAWQIAHLVYGDASKAALILQANAVHDPLFISAGTLLTIIPG